MPILHCVDAILTHMGITLESLEGSCIACAGGAMSFGMCVNCCSDGTAFDTDLNRWTDSDEQEKAAHDLTPCERDPYDCRFCWDVMDEHDRVQYWCERENAEADEAREDLFQEIEDALMN